MRRGEKRGQPVGCASGNTCLCDIHTHIQETAKTSESEGNRFLAWSKIQADVGHCRPAVSPSDADTGVTALIRLERTHWGQDTAGWWQWAGESGDHGCPLAWHTGPTWASNMVEEPSGLCKIRSALQQHGKAGINYDHMSKRQENWHVLVRESRCMWLLGGGSCRVCCPDGPCAHSWLLLGDPVARSVHHPHWALFPISIHVIPLCWPSTHLPCNEIKCGHPGSSVRSCEGLPMSSVPSQRGSVQGLYQGPGAPLTLPSGSMAWPHSRTGKMRGLELTPVLGWSLLSLLYTYNPDKNILLKATFLFLHPTVLSLRPNDVSLCYNNLGNLQMWHRLEPSPHIIAK